MSTSFQSFSVCNSDSFHDFHIEATWACILDSLWLRASLFGDSPLAWQHVLACKQVFRSLWGDLSGVGALT